MKPLILTLILLPALANANGQLFSPGFIVDAADERIHGAEIKRGEMAKPDKSTAYSQNTAAPNRYIFNDTDSINARKQRQFDTVKIADSWATYGRNK